MRFGMEENAEAERVAAPRRDHGPPVFEQLNQGSLKGAGLRPVQVQGRHDIEIRSARWIAHAVRLQPTQTRRVRRRDRPDLPEVVPVEPNAQNVAGV